MPMTLRTDAKKWFCGTCKEFTQPSEPPRLEQPKSDPSKPKGLWIRLAILVAFLLALALLRIYVV
jgi:hypothetical protein